MKSLSQAQESEARPAGPGEAVREKEARAAAFRCASGRLKLCSAVPIVLLILLILGSMDGCSLHKSQTVTRLNAPGETVIKNELIAIPGGTFQMGRDDSVPSEGPSHKVQVKTFEMDKTEVTNAEYGEFVTQTKHAPPEPWGAPTPPLGHANLPVTNVSYQDAVAFADWRSKRDGVTYRLPTEEEWEYAARNGDRNNLYPWGDTWLPTRAATLDAGVGKEQAVGSYPAGANRWGVHDLIGNVWEWTSSKASMYQGNSMKMSAQFQGWIVARGGGYSTAPQKISGALRDWFAPDYKNPVLGFRLVKVASSSH